MLFGPSTPPPTQFLTVEMPSSGPYLMGLLFNVVSQVVAIPLCILAFQLKKGPGVVLAVVAMVLAVLPLYVQSELAAFCISRGWATPLDTLAGRFCGSSSRQSLITS